MTSEGEKQGGEVVREEVKALREQVAAAEAEVIRLRETLVRVEEHERWLMGLVDRLLPSASPERPGTVAGARLWLWVLLAAVSGAAVAVSALRALGLW